MSEDPDAPAPQRPKPLSTMQLLGLVCVFALFGSVLSRINLFGPKKEPPTEQTAPASSSNSVVVVSNEPPVAVETDRP